MTFKDLFSQQSLDYAQYRPHYPPELFQFLSTLTYGHDLAWDCGTGNGQAAIPLTSFYSRVIATDPSEKQLAQAIKNSKIEYLQTRAENTSIPDHCIDLITVAQAFHWFQHEQFFLEAKRVLRPRGILAIWCYGLCQVSPEIDALVEIFYRDTLGIYWENERKWVDEGYANCPFPFHELAVPSFEMKATWNLKHFIGYLGTWSALQKYIKQNNSNPLEKLMNGLERYWGLDDKMEVRWKLFLRVGRS